jgi:hypothetical protein
VAAAATDARAGWGRGGSCALVGGGSRGTNLWREATRLAPRTVELCRGVPLLVSYLSGGIPGVRVEQPLVSHPTCSSVVLIQLKITDRLHNIYITSIIVIGIPLCY